MLSCKIETAKEVPGIGVNQWLGTHFLTELFLSNLLGALNGPQCHHYHSLHHARWMFRRLINNPPTSWLGHRSNSGKGGGERWSWRFYSAVFEWPASTHRAAQKARSPGNSSSRPEQGQFMAHCTKAHLVSPQVGSYVFQTKSSPGDLRVKPRIDVSFWDRRPWPFPRAAQWKTLCTYAMGRSLDGLS